MSDGERDIIIEIRVRVVDAERNPNVCSWCHEHLPEDRHGTGACNERCHALFRAEQNGHSTCCVVCEQDFTLSQLQRHASTCSPYCRKEKFKRDRRRQIFGDLAE